LLTHRQTNRQTKSAKKHNFLGGGKNCLKCWPMRTQARRRFLHSLTAVSIKFCSRSIQAVQVASWLHKHT